MNSDNLKEWSWEWVTADRVVCKGPCYLRKAVLTPDGSNNANVSIYDGVDTKGKLVITLRSGSTRSMPSNWATPIFLEQGLYIDCGTNLDGVHTQFCKC